MTASTDACREHWLEADAPRQIVDAIERHADAIQAALRQVGTGGPDCLSTRDLWANALEADSISVQRLGRTMGPNYAELGGYLVTGEPIPRDHHWLAVGPGLTLFDPTWGAFFRDLGPASLDRYIADDGRQFQHWRESELQRSCQPR